ncbi:putative Hematopoietic prostaglandin D synthase [Hypsibius exemplaris]|uniref:glutathione transferase n=1 Tax=Hypsibius exemplaris TaxID=2072580 RepID=A0A1W0WD67_HYPEX|nr:putative Hematopoietic prostaglandin D synthase [Hypsibius exemplaris]
MGVSSSSSIVCAVIVAVFTASALLLYKPAFHSASVCSMSEILSSISSSIQSHLGMAPKTKLFYFDARGRAEPIRWIFAYGGQEYEDVRISHADWPAVKATTPNGQLPYLEVDGKALAESLAIARYAARKNGLVGKDDFEAAQADALVDIVSGAATGLSFLWTEKDPAKLAELKANFVKVVIQPVLKKLERDLHANNNGEGFFVGAKPTWADLYVVNFLDTLAAWDATFLDEYKELKAHSQRVHELKGIKEWLLKRPVTAN